MPPDPAPREEASALEQSLDALTNAIMWVPVDHDERVAWRKSVEAARAELAQIRASAAATYAVAADELCWARNLAVQADEDIADRAVVCLAHTHSKLRAELRQLRQRAETYHRIASEGVALLADRQRNPVLDGWIDEARAALRGKEPR